MPRIDRERVEGTADTILLVGSFGLVLSFLAPWADVVIGSRGRGYMDTWGLAGSGHIALFLLALGVLALAALENPIGRWLRTGVAGVALGCFVLGLAWPYVVGPLGAGPGALSPGCPGWCCSSRGSSASSSSVTLPCRRTSERSYRVTGTADLPCYTASDVEEGGERRDSPQEPEAPTQLSWIRFSERSATRSAISSRTRSSSSGIQLLFAYLVVVWLATSYWAFRDMQQRTANPVAPYLAAAGIILFTPFFFFFAVWVYKIIRPHEKIGEVWERNLAEEALLAEVESIQHCPTCDRRVNEEWIICPTCRTRLNRVCPNCSRLVGLDWSLCAWCGKDFERREPSTATLEPLPGGLDATSRIAAPQARPSLRATRPSRPGSTALRRPGRAAGALIPPDGEPAPASATAPPDSLRPRPDPADPSAPARSRSKAAPRRHCTSSPGSRPSSGGGVLFVSLQTGAGAAKFVLFVAAWRCSRSGWSPRAGSQAIERRARGVRPYWGPSPVLVFLAFIPTAALPLVLLGVPLQLAGVDVDGPPVAVLALLVQAAVYVLLIRLVVVDTGALSWSEMRIRRPSVASFGELAFGARLGAADHLRDRPDLAGARVRVRR